MPCFSIQKTQTLITAVAFGWLAMMPQTLAQQSTPAKSPASAPSSLAPLSNSVPQLGKFTAPAKGEKLVFSHSSVALIPGEYKNGTWTAGVEIVLKPGWKTYWRVPGDAGVPAKFVWENSSNVASVDVSWPAPHRYSDVTGKSIGYKKHVIFPLTVTPKTAKKSATLDLRLYYAICSDICVPVQANVGLELPAGTQSSTSNASLQRIKVFAAIVPSTKAQGVKVVETTAAMVDGRPILSVTLEGNVRKDTDILVEGYEAAFFDGPKLQSSSNGKSVFHLPIDGIDKASELFGKSLKLTILSGDVRLETSTKLN